MVGMIQEKLCAFRALMRGQGMDAYLVPTADFHESECMGEHPRCKEYITGFIGPAGAAVVTTDEACLWVDGRYFVQASREPEGVLVTMIKAGQEGIPDVEGYLEQTPPSKGCLGFDDRVINAVAGLGLEGVPEDKNVRISYGLDLIGSIWDHWSELSAKSA